MSWSLTLIGAAPKVVEALKKKSETMTDPNSKKEFDAVLPGMIAALEQNFEQNYEVVVKLTANGHGSFVDGEQKSGTFQMNLERIYGEIV
jgi:hypothetical protein